MKGKGSEIIIFLIILLIGGLAIYYLVVDKINNKEEVTTTTTTTTTTKEANRLLDIKTFENYRYNSPVNKNSRSLYLRDDSFKKLDLEISNRCSRNYQTVDFNRNGNHITYKCVAIPDMDDGWAVDALINDKFKLHYENAYTCGGAKSYYYNDNYYLEYRENGCSSDPDEGGMFMTIIIYDKEATALEEFRVEWPIYFKNKGEEVRPFIYKNILYYITKEDNNICRINYYDFDTKEKKDLTSFECAGV